MIHIVSIALGSNLGDKKENINRAICLIKQFSTVTKQAKISNTENPYASVTNERAVELEMPVLAGMVIDRNVQSKDQITHIFVFKVLHVSLYKFSQRCQENVKS